MAKCDFCGKVYEKGTGKLFIRDNGKLINFCTGKCEKMMLVYKKKGREQKWTTTYHEEKNSTIKSGTTGDKK